MTTLKIWLETIYNEHGVGAAIAVAIVVLTMVLGIAHVAGIDIADAWDLFTGWLQ